MIDTGPNGFSPQEFTSVGSEEKLPTVSFNAQLMTFTVAEIVTWNAAPNLTARLLMLSSELQILGRLKMPMISAGITSHLKRVHPLFR